jgi:hypothetical protein
VAVMGWDGERRLQLRLGEVDEVRQICCHGTSRLRPLANEGRRDVSTSHPRHCRQHLLDVRICVLRLDHHRSALRCTLTTIAMASIMRPGLLRQACTKPAASQRMLSTITSSAINRPLAQQLRPAFQRSAIPKSTRIAAFHATQRNQILPPLPQKIIGTTNDPTPVPNPDYAHGSYHWSFERYAANATGERHPARNGRLTLSQNCLRRPCPFDDCTFRRWIA